MSMTCSRWPPVAADGGTADRARLVGAMMKSAADRNEIKKVLQDMMNDAFNSISINHNLLIMSLTIDIDMAIKCH